MSNGFTFEGLDELVEILNKAEARIPNTKQQFLAKEAGIIRGRVIKNTPVDTGLLKGSWKQTPTAGDKVTIYNNVEYSGFVEHGHRIKIRGKFTGRIVAGRHMLKKGIEQSRAQFQQDGMAILNSIFKG